MAGSTYDKTILTEEQRKQLAQITAEYDRASAAGDQAGMDSAHAAAENVRVAAGYSGGADGSRYAVAGYTASTLPSYTAQVDAVNDVYDAAREAQLAQLKSAYDQNNATLEAQRETIPGIYQAQRNAVAAASKQQGHAFNEYAAATGLNSGAGGQAALARSNVLQGNLGALNMQEVGAQRELEDQIAQLKVQYQNDISSAVAQGEYQRAAALLAEYQKAEESMVSTAQSQAGENYKQAAEYAGTLAQYGDFSGYKALGYDDDTIARMREVWIASNLRLAYYTGAITAKRYKELTGRYPYEE